MKPSSLFPLPCVLFQHLKVTQSEGWDFSPLSSGNSPVSFMRYLIWLSNRTLGYNLNHGGMGGCHKLSPTHRHSLGTSAWPCKCLESWAGIWPSGKDGVPGFQSQLPGKWETLDSSRGSLPPRCEAWSKFLLRGLSPSQFRLLWAGGEQIDRSVLCLPVSPIRHFLFSRYNFTFFFTLVLIDS